MSHAATYRYSGVSSFHGSELALVAADQVQRAEPFFRGRIGPGYLVAAGLLLVARVARSRFVVKPGELARLDPVLTVDDAGIHVESFTDDCSVHARFTMLRESLDAERWEPGTVNVDFNEPMRAALATARRVDPLSVAIGREGVAIVASTGEVVERHVILPDRWVRGFAEVQVTAAGLPRLGCFEAAAARRTLAALPRGRAGHNDLWGYISPREMRLTRVPGHGVVWVSAAERVRLLDPLMRYVRALSIFGHPRRVGVTVWAAEFDGAHLVLTLSPHRTRGFTGEGDILYALVDPRSSADAQRVEDVIGNRRRFAESDLAAAQLSRERLARALVWMGAHGTLGFDPLGEEWFRRELPFTMKQLSSAPPRLTAARALLEEDRVSLRGDDHAIVHGDHGEYCVELSPASCQCRWWREYPGDRGPCRHILAALLARSGTQHGE
jgi:hypothetical protein